MQYTNSQSNLEETLAAVAKGVLSPESAAERLRDGEVRYLDSFAVLDAGRRNRKGVPEVVYAAGKTPAQVAKICATLLESGGRVIVSSHAPEHEGRDPGSPPRSPAAARRPRARRRRRSTGTLGGRVGGALRRYVRPAGAGRALAVAREMGVSTKSFPDVGVAGIHRLAAPLKELEAFDPDCLVVAAGMEGALPSVVSGLTSVPVIGLPTSTATAWEATAPPPSSACSRPAPRVSRS